MMEVLLALIQTQNQKSQWNKSFAVYSNQYF